MAEDVTSPLGDEAEDAGDSFQKTQDGGFIVVATKEVSTPEGNDVWLIKADAEGNETWRKEMKYGIRSIHWEPVNRAAHPLQRRQTAASS